MAKQLDQYFSNQSQNNNEIKTNIDHTEESDNPLYLWIGLTELYSHNDKKEKFRFSREFIEYIKEMSFKKLWDKPIENQSFTHDLKFFAKYKDKVSKIQVENIIKECDKDNVTIITYNDPNYPVQLKKLSQPPLVLFLKGKRIFFNENTLKKSIAIVGTRNPSIYGHTEARKFSYALGKKSYTVISGMARGIDLEAHVGCISGGGITFAVLGGGVNKIYPPEHEEVYLDILENGLIISEKSPNAAPKENDFLFRNRIIASISSFSFIVEASMKSGTLSQVNYAKSLDKPIFVLLPNEYTKNYETSELIRKLLKEDYIGFDKPIDLIEHLEKL